jgi:hypothetical protein
MHQRMLMATGRPGIALDAAEFDGTNDRMNATTNFSAASSKKATCFFWIKVPSGVNQNRQESILSGKSAGAHQIVNIERIGTLLVFELKDATGNAAANYQVNIPSFDVWHSVLVSLDVTPTAVGRGYINDSASGSLVVSNNLTLGFNSVAQYYFGANFTPVNLLGACVAQFWFGPGQLLDLSIESVRRGFVGVGNTPVHFGTTGLGPTGVLPAVYCNIESGEAVANFATNRTGNGNFTITGALATCGTHP